MKKVLIGLSVIFALLAAVPYSSYAAPDISWGGPFGANGASGCNCGQGGMQHGRMMKFQARRQMMWEKTLGLSKQQEEAIRQIKTSTLKETIRKRADVEIARVDLMSMLRKDHVDMSAVEVKLKQIASLQTDLRLARIKAFEGIKSELAPQQRTKLRENLRGLWMHKGGTGMNGCNKGKGFFHNKD